MSSGEFRYMVWGRDCNGTWKLKCRGLKRSTVETEIPTMPQDTVWRFVSQCDGLLAESLTRDPGAVASRQGTAAAS